METDHASGEEKENWSDKDKMDGSHIAHPATADMHGPPPPELGSPLLPPSLARTITLGTGTIRGAVRTARSVGRVPFYAAQYTTAAGIEISRRVLDATLGQTGRNLCAQCVTVDRGAGSGGGDGDGESDEHNDGQDGDADRARMESVVRSTSEAAQRGFNYLQLVTAAGFELTGSSVATLMDASEVLLMLLNNTLGSTESSRALRSILKFLSQEFQNPATGLPGERVGMRDLLWGVCGLVYLQSVCRQQDEQLRVSQALETVVWDVVVLDGQRVDVHESSLYGMHRGSYQPLRTEQKEKGHMDGHVDGAGDNEADSDEPDLAESLIRSQVLAATSSDARITVSTTTTKTVTVDITASQPPPPIAPPHGVELVELGPLRSYQDTVAGSHADQSPTTYRIVFRINMDGEQTGPDSPTSPALENTIRRIEQVDDSSSDTPMENAGIPSTEKTTAPTTAPIFPTSEADRSKPLPASPTTAAKGAGHTRYPLETLQPQPSVANQKKVRQPAAAAAASSTQSRTSSSRTPVVPGRRSSGQATTTMTASTKPATTATDKKASGGIRAAFKKPALGNLLHKEPPSSNSQSKSATTEPASSTLSTLSSTARKSATTRALSPPASLVLPNKKSKTNRGKASDKEKADNATAPSAPPSRTSAASNKTQLVRTPLTSGALYRHESPPLRPPTPARDSDMPHAYGSVHHRRGKSTIPDDLRSIASFASLASSLADNISIHTTQHDTARPGTATSPKGHRSRAHRGSIYTLHTNDSQASLILSAYGPGRRSYMDSGGGGGGGGGGPPGGLGSDGYGHGPGGPAGKKGHPMRPFDMLSEVRRTGRVPGMFPQAPLARNLQRYMRFSSAAYGRDFLRAMSITSAAFGPYDGNDPDGRKQRDTQNVHHELVSYARHTGVAPADILMASFIDVKGGPDAAGLTRMPLVHYITLDHASKAVVLACRGTLGFEDILADMACEYDDLYWRGRTYQVHKGVHASARRILYGGDGRVLATLRDALLTHPDYGLVLCGHSLGGAVTALLGVMLSEPRPVHAGSAGNAGNASGANGSASASASETASAAALGHYCFQTKSAPLRLLASAAAAGTSGSASASREVPSLPPGRPVHVFAFGPPGTMTPALCKMTRGLITSVVQGNDLVPYLSLGVLHDLQAVALAFKTDKSHASAELWSRMWHKMRTMMTEKVFGKAAAAAAAAAAADSAKAADNAGAFAADPGSGPGVGIDDAWAYAALKTLRVSMMSPKLLPPGEVLVVEMQRVLQRTSYGTGAHAGGGGGTDAMLMVLPAQRVVFKHVRDVEARFREIQFSLAAFTDHSPGRYEKALDQLVAGV
ncbi:hypothetical protein SPBR_04569 [Sporothrix brasiliensis 5110]|uniref:sn-1-specific diacylglycerol lipase n=1 Tax=Sporothrix brasiliensis 5110 TaxID=1398154 RepID=A0A0C2IKB9_9PEZI|nr:uncharacterized protein SPBR_04569 [Sporothrix brasiliensis 5110]KIH87445.1 hypothetical protein SPBR_04569 [Sporothrix brasiliensis 5110]